MPPSNDTFLGRKYYFYKRNLTLSRVVLYHTITDNESKEDCVGLEVLRRLKCWVETIQARTQDAVVKSDHSWWPLRESKAAREPFLGYQSSMTMSNQLGLTEDSLAKALKGQSKRVTESSLMNTLPGCFIFRKLGDSKCVAVASKAGQSVWADSPEAVPTKKTIVQQNSIHATQLLRSICCKPVASLQAQSISPASATPAPSDPNEAEAAEAAEAIIELAGTADARPVLENTEREAIDPLEAGRALFASPDSQGIPPVTPDVGTQDINPNNPLDARIALFDTPNSQVMPVTPDVTREAANLLHSLSNRNQFGSKHNPNRKLEEVALPNGYVATIPSLYDIKSKKKIKEWERCEATVRNIEKVLNAGKYKGTYLGKRLLAAGMAHDPLEIGCPWVRMIIGCAII
jgi:hypothetical protein